MSEHSKISASHRSRQAVVYVRQSTLTQLERNTESTARQYDLRERAVTLGWSREQVRVIDVDLGISGSVLGQRNGFETLVADVAMGQIGIVLALEVSRLARDNAAWYRLLDLAGACDTLVADADGDRKSTRLNSSHVEISYAVFCLKKKKKKCDDEKPTAESKERKTV